jgi:predicted enzyme related to lactoylglutathione lyase
MDVTSTPAGNFIWADLASSDAVGAKEFYSAIFGWAYNDLPMGEGQAYSMCLLGGRQACALHGMTMGQPPHWSAYIALENADAGAANAKELGASVLMEPFDVFDSVRLAVLQDPTGAVISLCQPLNNKGFQVADEHGAVCWNEHNTRDTEKAAAFYTDLLGWTKFTHEGPMTYTEFSNNGKEVAGMMQIQPEWGPDVPPHWLVYFSVADVDASVERIKELRGRVLAGPMSIPDGGRFAVIMDPQGAVFGIYKSAS